MSKRAKKNDGTPASRGGSALTSTTIDDLTALTTAQLYSLSSRRHRDESRESVRRAQDERDRAYVQLEQAQRWLERSNEHLERMEESAREAHREYIDAKNLLVRVRQASSAAVAMMGGRAAADDSSDDEAGILGIVSGRMSTGSPSKSRKVAFIQQILSDAAKAGDLTDGKNLEDLETDLVPRKDRSQFVYSMKLVEELWTEEEELFLRSTPDEIAESLEELKVITETIAVRCLTKLNEWEGRPDPTPTGHQKPSFVSLGTRARKIFANRKKGEEAAAEQEV